uniref:hypothetical protein n=1 Tax=Flavobacterium sp. TaxID=239 RepID=UPI00404994DF
MKTELEKRASKFIDETDTMQFTTMELLTMFAEKEQALQLLQTDVSMRSEQLFTYCVVCGEKYQNPKNDSDTCYDCREPYCK